MNVQLTSDRGVGYGAMQYEGEVVDLPTDEAKRLIKSGGAIVPETAVASTGREHAAVRVSKPQPRTLR